MSETSKIPFLPGPGRVVLARQRVAEFTEGGIKIPDDKRHQMESQNFRATVVAIGADEVTDYGEMQKFPWEVGDDVMIDTYCGRSLEIAECDLILVVAKFGEVMGKFLAPAPPVVYVDASTVSPELSRIIVP